MRARKPRLKLRQNPGGSKSWCVDAGIISGKRHRRFFATKGEAQTYAEQVLISERNYGAAAFSLSDRERADAAEAIRRLQPSGASLVEAAEYYLKHAKPRGGTRSAIEATAELVESKRRSGKKPRYIKALRIALSIFNREFGAKGLHEIHRPEVEMWLNEQSWSAATRRNYIRDVGILFNFGVERGHCAENPLTTIEKPMVDDRPPEIFSVGDAGKLLQAAYDHPELGLLPVVAIGLFAGLRASEIEILDWGEVDLQSRAIEVKALKSKTRRRRIVDISDNLAAWLAPFTGQSGLVAAAGWRERLQRLSKLAGLSRWPHNGLRHSFASYHLARHQNAALTALQLGHADTTMLFTNYRELVKAQEAKTYWEIRPDAASNVLRLAAG